MNLTIVLFYIISLIVLVSAVYVIFSTNIIHSALYLVLTFIGVACVFILLSADFLAVAQILIYVGAISVLLVFSVMLTIRGEDIQKTNPFNQYKFSSGLVVLIFFLFILRILLLSSFAPSNIAFPQNTVVGIANLMLNQYILPFEISGILLLVALVGAITLGKGINKPK